MLTRASSAQSAASFTWLFMGTCVFAAAAPAQTCRGTVPSASTWSHLAAWTTMSDSTFQLGGRVRGGTELIFFGFDVGWLATDEIDVDNRPTGTGLFGLRAPASDRLEICPSVHASLGLSSGPTHVSNAVHLGWIAITSGQSQFVPFVGLGASYVRRDDADVTPTRPKAELGGFTEAGLGFTIAHFNFLQTVRYRFDRATGTSWSLGLGVGLTVPIGP